MSKEPLDLVLITGSARRGRFCPTVTGWFAGRARLRTDMRVEVVDPAESPSRPGGEAAEPTLSARLAAADAFVVVTPEYNHSFPAPLKHLIDSHHREWHAKPVGFVSYGGISGGLRAVEQLRLVFAELHAVTIRDTVSFHNARERFDAEGDPKDPASNVAATTLLDRLSWWGRVLRDARTEHPYVA
ncbi:NAD(P)H-dependent FMN reductase [Thermomonospora echinospora]|uniref:NAD(P)H-dependent FMN reductase n=1 Tax=Thermomonospora echinospora TaxID=1992 RepID=A0A1H6DC43_9ACTN|nr:NAD(P)H-dependent oxidoreductase [Thermomonospora echinospora]SEG82383.1 NAD(P)H-dependent FMN reductase [Thermomonospora echinospora]